MARNGREKPNATQPSKTPAKAAHASTGDADTLKAVVAAKDAELQAIADNTPLVLVRCGRDLTYKFINKAGAALFGKTPEQVVGRSIVEMMGEANFALIRPKIRRVLRGEKVEYETTLDYPAVGRRIMHVSYAPERDPEGRVTGWLASLVDITEQKDHEADQNFLFAIAEMIRTASNAEDLLAGIAEALGKYLGLHRCLFNEIDLASDVEVVHRDYSRTSEHVAGKHRISTYSTAGSKAMSKGRTVVNKDSKTDPNTRSLYKKVYGPSKERSYVAVPMLREGRWVASLWCSDDEPRDWTAAEVALVESIAERTWAAVERVRNEQALEDATLKFESVFNQSGIFAGILDLDGTMREINDLAVDLCGYRREEVLDRPFWKTAWWRGSTRSQARIKEAVRTAQRGDIFRETLSYWVADGTERLVDFAMYPIRDDEGKIVFLHPTGIDITERVEAQEALRTISRLPEENPFPVMRVSRNGQVNYANPAAAPLLDLWRKADGGDLPSEVMAAIRRSLRNDTRESVEIAFEDRTFACTIAPVPEAGGVNLYATDITGRKQAEQQRAELLEREAQARREAETLNELSRTLAAELDLQTVVQITTDAATRLVRAHFGAFFYNLIDEKGESYQLYTLSGAPRSAFEKFGMPRNTPIFDPTFRGEGVVRIDDVTKDPRYGHMAPHHGMPKGHLPVTSYLAAPVISRSGEVLGGLFFGHPEPGVFQTHDERMVVGLAAIAAVAMDNARLYGDAQREIKQRRLAEVELRKSENQVRVVTDAMPALISYVDRHERYVFANQTYRQWFGVEPSEIVGRKTKTVFGAKAYSTIKPWVESALSGRECRFETDIVYKDGRQRFIHAAYVPDVASDGTVRGYFGFTVDMTDLQRSQELLRVTEEKTSMMMDICRDYAIFSTDQAGIVDSWNTGAEQIFGYPEKEAIGLDGAMLFTPEDRGRGIPEKEMRTAKRLGRASDERWHIRKDGTRFYASGVMMPLYVGKTLAGYAKIASDLTERQRHAEELQRAHDELELRVADRTKELAESNAALIREAEARIAAEQQRIYLLRRLVTSQEFERRRIARDIHDQLGQRLTGLRLKLASLRSVIGDDDEVAGRVTRLQEISERLDAEVSFLAWELRPTSLDDLGLIEALRAFVKEWSRHHEINAHFQAVGASDVRLDPDVDTHLYRITQEALNNTMKHARAANVNVMLERRKDKVILIIEDDGVGFDPSALTTPRKSGKGLGLMGMRERASLIGGEFEMESGPGGTTIYVRVRPSDAPTPL